MRNARRSFVSGRGAVLIGVMVIAVVLLAMPLREYLGQRSAMNSMRQQTQEHQARVNDLQHQLDQWQDPEYFRQAARRWNYVLPGEVGYIVVEAGDAKPGPQSTGSSQVSSDRPWFATLWRSVQGADR